MQKVAEQSKGRVHVLDEMVYNDPKLMQPHFKKLLPTHKLLIKLVYRVCTDVKGRRQTYPFKCTPRIRQSSYDSFLTLGSQKGLRDCFLKSNSTTVQIIANNEADGNNIILPMLHKCFRL